MKALKFLFVGIFFGIVLTKGQVISWFRIYEMFKFESFHMYGIIGSAIFIGVIGIQLIKRKDIKDITGADIHIAHKEHKLTAGLLGGILFGLGWAMTGACPGPLFILLGNGVLVFSIVILAATVGTFLYGIVKNKLPH
ncbi:MAG: DUF6691 family protein [Cyclobacteriaceae bacterium]